MFVRKNNKGLILFRKKFNKDELTVFLFKKIKNGIPNGFAIRENDFINELKKSYKCVDIQSLEDYIQQAKAHNYIKNQCMNGCHIELTDRGKGVAISKVKQQETNLLKKLLKLLMNIKF